MLPSRSAVGYRRPVFTPALAAGWQRPAPGARLVEVDGGHTFLPLDEPDRLASEISTFLVPA